MQLLLKRFTKTKEIFLCEWYSRSVRQLSVLRNIQSCVEATAGRTIFPGADPGGAIGAIASPKTYESNFIHHDFVQFGKQHSRYKAILPSIVDTLVLLRFCALLRRNSQ